MQKSVLRDLQHTNQVWQSYDNHWNILGEVNAAKLKLQGMSGTFSVARCTECGKHEKFKFHKSINCTMGANLTIKCSMSIGLLEILHGDTATFMVPDTVEHLVLVELQDVQRMRNHDHLQNHHIAPMK